MILRAVNAVASLLGVEVRGLRPFESPSVPLSGATLEMMGGYGNYNVEAGTEVTEETVLQLAAVWQAVQILSGDVSKLPLCLYDRAANDERKRNRLHPAAKLVDGRANREIHSLKLWRRAMAHAAIWGNAYIYIDRSGDGTPLELINLRPDSVSLGREQGRLYYEVSTQWLDGASYHRRVDPLDILHIEGINVDNLAACPWLHYARQVAGLGLAVQKYTGKFFRNGVQSGGILQVPPSMKPDTAEKLEQQFAAKYSGTENAFRTLILRDGATFHKTSIAPNEAQMVETREQQVREIARFFNIPPSKFGLADSVSYNSKSEDARTYLDGTLSYWIDQIRTECDLKLLTPGEQDARYFEHNSSALLELDTEKRFNVYAVAVRSHIMTPNECRKRENLPAIEGGDEFPDTAAMAAAAAVHGGNGGVAQSPLGGPVAGKAAGGSDKGGAAKPRGKAK